MNTKSDNPRYIAFQILRGTRKNYFSQVGISEYLDDSELSSRDKALVTQFVNGINRDRLFLDWAIGKVSSIPIYKLDNDVKILLRLGTYQLLRLTRVPPYAAISETVEISKLSLKSKLVKFINAVLRSIDRSKEDLHKGPSKDNMVKFFSIYYSHPEWLIARWYERWGEEFTQKLCEFNNTPPRLTIRVNSLKISPSGLAAHLNEEGINTIPSKFIPEGLVIIGNLRAEDLTAYKEGLFTIQGEASILAGKIFNPRPGDNILDLCSAPGNKATHMGELMKNQGNILAVDISEKRLPFLQTNCQRLGIKNITSLTSDVLSMGSEFENKFDGVFLDSPCSGTGVLGRRSDLRWKKNPEDIKRLSILQMDLLKKASTFVRTGGYMVYSVCSIEPEEGEDVINRFLLENKDFLLEDISRHYKSDNSENGLLIFPPLHQIEGFFVSRLRRKNL